MRSANCRLKPRSRLLRVLQEREIERVGGTQPIAADVRILPPRIVTSRRPWLQARSVAISFTGSTSFPIAMPPLRERREDIPLLVESFIDRYRQESGEEDPGVNSKTGAPPILPVAGQHS